MDSPDGPMSRVGRTFWSVWTYISEAVNRFLRPEPANTQSSDPIASQRSADNNEPADSGHPVGDTGDEGVDEEQPLAKTSLLSSSQPVVAWESCTTEIDLGPVEESAEYKSLLCEGGEGKAPEEGEQLDKIRNDDVEPLVAKDASTKGDKEEDSDRKLYSRGQGETPEYHEREEHAKVGPLNLAEDRSSEDIEGGGRQAGAEDETRMAPDDARERDETRRRIQIKEEEGKMHQGDELTLNPTADFSLDVERSVHTGESRPRKDEEDTAVVHNGAQAVPESEHKCDKEAEQDEHVFSVNEELSEEERDAEGDPSVAELGDDLQMTFSVSEDDGQTQVMAQSSEGDEAEDEREREDESTPDKMERSKEENTSDAAEDQEEGEEPEQREDVKTMSENSQSLFAQAVDQFGQTKNDDVERPVAKDASAKEDKEEDSDWKLCSHGQSETPENEEHEEHAEVAPPNFVDDTVCGDTEGGGSRAGAEDETREALDDAQEMKSGQSGEENNPKIADNQEVDEKPEQEEEDIEAVSGDSRRIFTEDVRHNEEVVQNSEATLHTVEIADDEKEDVAEVGAKTRETDAVDGAEIAENSCATTADISEGDGLCNEDQVGEERLSFEKQDVRESYMETAGTTTSVTVNPIGETGQEIGGELKNPPLRICEGPVVESQRLTSLTSEETQEGVPGYNNEPEPDENTTQRLLEVENGNGKEIHATLLPEGEGSPQNSGTRADYLTLREHMEDSKERAGVLHLTDTGLPQKTERHVESAGEEPGHVFEGGDAKLFSVKMGIEHIEKDFETHGGVTDEAELRGATEGLLVEFETDEGLNGSKDSSGGNCETAGVIAVGDLALGFTDEVKPQTNFYQESADAMNFEQNSNVAHSLLEDFSESGFMKDSAGTEPKILEESTVEMQDAGIDIEEPGCGAEEEEVEGETQNKFFNPQVAGRATDRTAENNPSVLFGESELPSLTIESRPEDMTLTSVVESEGSYGEETQSPVSGCQDVIEEEILDLWIQTALSKDNGDMEEESVPGQQTDARMAQEHQEHGELPVQAEKETEQIVESSSGESGLLTDTEMSSSTTESGFLDQSASEWGTNHSDAGSFQGSLDKLPSLSESADACELSEPQPGPESVEPGESDLTWEDSAVETGSHQDSGAGPSETDQIQEVEKSQARTDEEQVEPAPIKTESQEETDADVMDQAKGTDGEDTEGSDSEAPFLKDEETGVEDAPLEVTASEDESKDAESEQSGSGSEASPQDEIMLGHAQTHPRTLMKSSSLDEPQPRWSQDVPESPPELNRADGTEQPTTGSENQMEVDGSTLDFTPQRSRIAVKNPRVRPPKDPRSLLNMPSVDPTPSPRLPVKVPVGVPLGGMGIGIKLPGLGAGFPVLKKTQRGAREEKSSDTGAQEPETKSEEVRDTPKQDEAQHRPKWMPPKQAGFGNPLMSELKSKLKKTTEE